jgi:nucleoside-diphosphate-sugar epimerase
VPNIGWNIVDVRDIAELHVLAMTSPTAAGRRFLGSGSFWWYRDIARILREKLPDEAATVPTRTMPDIIVKLLADLNPQMAMLRPELGRTRSSTAARPASSSAGIPAPPSRPSSTPPPRSSPTTRVRVVPAGLFDDR